MNKRRGDYNFFWHVVKHGIFEWVTLPMDAMSSKQMPTGLLDFQGMKNNKTNGNNRFSQSHEMYITTLSLREGAYYRKENKMQQK